MLCFRWNLATEMLDITYVVIMSNSHKITVSHIDKKSVWCTYKLHYIFHTCFTVGLITHEQMQLAVSIFSKPVWNTLGIAAIMMSIHLSVCLAPSVTMLIAQYGLAVLNGDKSLSITNKKSYKKKTMTQFSMTDWHLQLQIINNNRAQCTMLFLGIGQQC